MTQRFGLPLLFKNNQRLRHAHGRTAMAVSCNGVITVAAWMH